MLNNFLAAFALLLVFEGMLPFMSPEKYRDITRWISQQRDRHLRTFGFITMIIGAVMLVIMHQWVY